MSGGGARRSLAKVAADYQAEAVIPHCASCSRPCCRLDVLVLEMSWPQVRTLWQLSESQAAFDARLAAGRGPEEIRPWQGLYHVHSKPCPAFDASCGRCKVYGQPAKPAGCSDFPVYEDGGELVADLRCEAVDVAALSARLAQALGEGARIVEAADRAYPFLVTLSVTRAKPRRAAPSTRR